MRSKLLIALPCALGLMALWAYCQTPSGPVGPTPTAATAPQLPALSSSRSPVEAPVPAAEWSRPPSPTVQVVDDVAALMKTLTDIRAERTRLDKREQETIQLLRQKLLERRQALRRLEEDLRSLGVPGDENPVVPNFAPPAAPSPATGPVNPPTTSY